MMRFNLACAQTLSSLSKLVRMQTHYTRNPFLALLVTLAATLPWEATIGEVSLA